MDIAEAMDDDLLFHITDEFIPSFNLMFNNVSQSKWVGYILIGTRTLLVVYIIIRLFYLITIKHRKTYKIQILLKLVSSICIILYLFWDVYKRIKKSYKNKTKNKC